MSRRHTLDDGGNEGTSAVERHLSAALDATDPAEMRFHLRQGLQHLKVAEEHSR